MALCNGVLFYTSNDGNVMFKYDEKTTVDTMWKRFAGLVLKKVPQDSEQYDDMHKAFMAGGLEVFILMTQYIADLPEGPAEKRMSALADEFKNWSTVALQGAKLSGDKNYGFEA